MKKVSDIANIIAAVLRDQATEEELHILEEWKQRSPRHVALYNKIIEKENVREAGRLLHQFDKEEGWANICKQFPIEKKIIRRRELWLSAGKYAAVLMVCVGGWMFFHSKEEVSLEKAIENPIATTAEVSEHQGVVLKLANGRVINLKEDNGTVNVGRGQGVITNNNGLLSYRDIPQSEDGVTEYNEIYVARGETFQLELCDGSRIHLNAMSKMRYPVSFGQTTRVIELEGEAYLEVTKDSSHPFIVKTKDFSVKVLGTKFNLSAYPEDYQINTTLIEGAVVVESSKYHVQAQLKPEEQLRFDKMTLNQTIEKVDVSYATAWLHGKLRFRDIQLGELMKTLQRWYDIDVDYDTPEIRNFTFGCSFNRMDSIQQLLEVIEQTKKVSISRQGKHLQIGVPR